MSVQIDLSRDALFDELGLQRLRESYMREGETSPQERYAFVAESLRAIPNMRNAFMTMRVAIG